MGKFKFNKTRIQEVEEIADFERVYRVFEGEPYNEIYTREEIEELYKAYTETGKVFGFYVGDVCAGIVAYKKNPEGKYPVKYEDGMLISYLADIAVLDEFRNTGIGTSLMLYALFDAKSEGYKKMFMRTLEKEKSMSYGIAKSVGYREIDDVKQIVTRERNVDGCSEEASNIFLDIDLERDLNKEKSRKLMEMLVYEREQIEEER